nr:YjbH domain-containing protein [Stagnihabitans tardus]
MRLSVARLLGGVALACMASATGAEMVPSVNMIGNTGLIDMPSGDMQPDGFITVDSSRMGPIFRYSIAAQFTPRLTGTFRYIGIRNWNDAFCPGPQCLGVNSFETYYDRNFDISYQILTEGRYRPALSIGLLDFAGTGINAGEYVAATKTFGDRLKVTAGLGFGRLATYNPIATLGTRPKASFGMGGKPNYDLWFRGDVAPFGGIEYAINDKWRAKVEYSSDAYSEEAGVRGTFRRSSPFNFGIEYQPSRAFHLGAYYMYGDQIGMNLAISINPNQRPTGNLAGPAPYPVLPRPSPQSDPGAWVTGWTETEGVNASYLTALQNYIDRDLGIIIESLDVTDDRVQVRYRSSAYDAASQPIGRIARALTYVVPASIEVFELVPLENGMAATKVVIYRSNLEKFEGELGAGPALLIRSHIQEAGTPPEGMATNPDLYPRFTWSIVPTGETRTFDPADPFQINIGARANFRLEPAPGLIFAGSVVKTLSQGITNDRKSNSVLPHVRTEASSYQVVKTPVVDSLTAAYYARLGPNLYGRVTAGYLERMFGGVSAEMLYRPEGKAWSLGIEANYVAQRDLDGMLGFDHFDYSVATGHVSGYLDMGRGYNLQLDVGRYLAGDVGATLTLSREFANGWRMGGFATLTNVSAADFGEGSFDKGIYVHIPTNWFLGRPSRSQRNLVIRPIQRDGGARLAVEGRLYETLRDYDAARITADWGRVWK